MIPEILGGAHRDPKTQAVKIGQTIRRSLDELGKLSNEEIVQNRYDKFRKIGVFTE